MSAFSHGINRGRRSGVISSKTDTGVEAMWRLCPDADVFLRNIPPGAAERLGPSEPDLRAVDPDLVSVDVIQAMAAMAALQADDDGLPQLTRQVVVDEVTAHIVAQAITAALYHRERCCGGLHVQLSMLDTALWSSWPDGDDGSLVGGRWCPARTDLRQHRGPRARAGRLHVTRLAADGRGRACARHSDRSGSTPPLRHAESLRGTRDRDRGGVQRRGRVTHDRAVPRSHSRQRRSRCVGHITR